MASRLSLPQPILDDRIIAVLRAPVPEHLVPVGLTLFDAGIRCLEVALTSPGAFEAIEALRSRLGADAAIGAGTVMTTEDVRRAASAGATYLLSPLTDPAVIAAAAEHNLPFVPGAGTATEIATAWALGTAAVKVFPAQSLGGPGFVKSILDPLPGMSLMPTGGIGAGDVSDYLNAGAIAVGVGSPLTGKALVDGSTGDLKASAGAFLAACARNGKTS